MAARRLHSLTIGAIASHHFIERAAGIGLPGEPMIGHRAADVLWPTLFAGNLVVVGMNGGVRDGLVSFANGAYQALALLHYVDWPWRLRRGVPIITEAEGLPKRWLPAYSTVLLATIAASTIVVAADRRPRIIVGHLVGLATLPLQLASARKHQRWLRSVHGQAAE